MSVIPKRGVLHAHYRDAVQDTAPDDGFNIEFKAAAFWQVLLHSHFPLNEDYSVTAESGPAGTSSLRRVDIIVKRLVPGDYLMPVLAVEVKRPSGDIAEAEWQVLDATDTLIDRYMLKYAYGISAIGTSFRGFTQMFSTIREDRETLHSYDEGLPDIASRGDYIDVSTREGTNMFRGFIRMVKRHPPTLRPESQPGSDPDEHDVMGDTAGPSSWSQPQPPYHDQTYTGYEMDQAQDPVAEPFQPPLGQSGYEEMDQTQDSVAEEVPVGGADQGGRPAARTAETWSKVEVRKTRHLTRPDEYFFTTNNHHVRTTGRDDWTEAEHKGKRAWYHRHKGVYYYTREKP